MAGPTKRIVEAPRSRRRAENYDLLCVDSHRCGIVLSIGAPCPSVHGNEARRALGFSGGSREPSRDSVDSPGSRRRIDHSMGFRKTSPFPRLGRRPRVGRPVSSCSTSGTRLARAVLLSWGHTGMGTLPNISGTSHGVDRIGRPSSSHRELSGDAELLEAMVEGASEGLVLLTSEGLILRANRSAAEMIGQDRDRIIGRPIQDLFFKAAFDETFIGEIVTTSLTVSRTYDLVDGRSLLVLGRPVAAGAARVVLALRDVTRMRQLVSRTQGPAKPAWPEMRRTATTAAHGAPVVTTSVAMRGVRDK